MTRVHRTRTLASNFQSVIDFVPSNLILRSRQSMTPVKDQFTLGSVTVIASESLTMLCTMLTIYTSWYFWSWNRFQMSWSKRRNGSLELEVTLYFQPGILHKSFVSNPDVWQMPVSHNTVCIFSQRSKKFTSLGLTFVKKGLCAWVRQKFEASRRWFLLSLIHIAWHGPKVVALHCM